MIINTNIPAQNPAIHRAAGKISRGKISSRKATETAAADSTNVSGPAIPDASEAKNFVEQLKQTMASHSSVALAAQAGRLPQRAMELLA